MIIRSKKTNTLVVTDGVKQDCNKLDLESNYTYKISAKFDYKKSYGAWAKWLLTYILGLVSNPLNIDGNMLPNPSMYWNRKDSK